MSRELIQSYVDAGFIMFPCVKGGKRPAVEWKKFIQSADARNVGVLIGWLDRGYNLAVALKPSGYVALDLDSYKKDLNPLDIPATSLVQNTPRGGKHYLYRPNGNADIVRDIQMTDYGIDVKYHGYVLIAPSRVKYDDGFENVYTWDQWGQAADLPHSFNQFFDKKSTSSSATLDDVLIAATHGQTDPIDDVIRIVDQGFTEGSHNVELRDVARTLYRVMAGDNNDLKAQLIAKIMLTLDRKDKTPQGDEQALETVKNAIVYEHTRMAKKSPKTANNGASKGGVAAHQDSYFDASTYAEVYTEYADYKVDYIIPDFLPRSAIMMMSAPPESFKTWLLFDMATSIALNRPFLGLPHLSPNLLAHKQIEFAGNGYGEPVMIVQQEDFIGLQIGRLETIITSKWGADNYKIYQAPDGDNYSYVIESPHFAPIYMHTRRMLSLDDPDSVKKLEERVKENGISHVFIDPFYTLSSDTDQFFASAGKKLQMFRGIRDSYGTGFMIAHHSTKSNSGARGRDNAWGSQFLLGAVEGFVAVTPTPPNQVEIEVSGKFFPKQFNAVLSFDIDTEEKSYKVRLENSDEAMSGNAKVVYEAVIEAGIEGVTPTSIESTLGLNKGTVSRILKNLVEKGVVIKAGRKYVSQDVLDIVG